MIHKLDNPEPRVRCLECGHRNIDYGVQPCPGCGHPVRETVDEIFMQLRSPYRYGTDDGPSFCIVQLPLDKVAELYRLSISIKKNLALNTISNDDPALAVWTDKPIYSDQFDYCNICPGNVEIPEKSFRTKKLLDDLNDEEGSQVTFCTVEISKYGIWWKSGWDTPAYFETEELSLGELLGAALHNIHRVSMRKEEFLRWHRKFTQLKKRLKSRF